MILIQQVIALAAHPVRVPHIESFTGHIFLACVVSVLCNPLFGLIALFLAGALDLYLARLAFPRPAGYIFCFRFFFFIYF